MNIRYDLILGSKRTSNYLWMLMTFIGGSGFFLAGLSSYLGFQLLPFADTKEIVFIPQGIVMTFYGTTGLLLSTFLGATIYLNVGGGYNLYDKKNKKIENLENLEGDITRKMRPARNFRLNYDIRTTNFTYYLKVVQKNVAI